MGISQGLYFTSLLGAIGGLLAWGLAALISSAVMQQQGLPTSDFIAALAIGAFVGGLTAGFTDHSSGDRLGWWPVATGFAIGIGSAAVAVLIQIAVATSLAGTFPDLARLISWVVLGSLVGLGLGLRWIRENRLKAPYGLAGGMLGGGLSGLLFTVFGSHGPDFVQALAFVLTGASISFGVAFAPILVQHGLLQFISSGDGRAQSKLSRANKGEWPLEQGRSYTIGSQEPPASSGWRGNVIFIPDAAVAPRHAVLFGQRGRFYLARHPEIGGQAGLAHFVLRLRGRTVVKTGELRDSDDILVGRTALKFTSRDVANSE
jgi:hypothetical protein